jgi:hypothetical protein
VTATAIKVVLLLAAGAGQLDHPTPATASRELCGPIAVQTVLRYFGKDVALPELTEEVFGESGGRFSSMAALSDCLRHHGLYTLALEIGKDHRIAWGGPVIIHLPSSSPQSGGHFAVVLPHPEGDRWRTSQTVSLTPGTTTPVPWRKLSVARSRIVLLTSACPVNSERSLTGLNRGKHRHLWAAALVGSAFVTGLCLHVFRRRSL